MLSPLLGDVWDSTRLGQVGTLPFKVFKRILVLHQVVHLGLWKHRLLQVLLIASHVKATRIESKLVLVTRHS
jgi:hypothetical protein